ncbi:AsmA-like C-terminal region-containing protein [Hymenobacter sp. DG01]|uniref:YhdP family protein n=1 Tax=Hymenobacter sp. DG01 TaxID=2584940 RepID=UPI00111F132B|nr:AsmA-like C-terminal region-containing protein [Hymenobacter sp. DG01]
MTLGVLLGSALAGLWLGQERIIALFVEALNRHLQVPVQASRLEVSVLDQFPRLSVTLHDVVVAGSEPTDTVKLARARRLYCAFDAWDLLAGRYHIRAITLADAYVRVRRNQQGVGNYHVLRPDTTTAATEPFGMELEGIRLERVGVLYEDAARRQHFRLRTPDLRAALTITDTRLDIAAQGLAYVTTLRFGPDDYFQQKELRINTELTIDRPGQQLTLAPSRVQVGPAAYTVAGTIGYRGAPVLDLRCQAAGADVQSVLALLPPRLTRALAGYRSRGAVYFGGTVRGEVSEQRNPTVAVRFGCRNASFFHPRYQQAVEKVSLTGFFTNGARQSAATTVLRLDSIRGQLGGRPFRGQLQLENFVAPRLQLLGQAEVDVAPAVRFFPVAAIRQARGTAALHLRLNGLVRDLRSQPTPAQASGELRLQNLQLQLRDFRQPFTRVSGQLQLRGTDVLISTLSGQLGNSDFRGRGRLRNLTGWLLRSGQPLRLEATVASHLLDFNQLLYTYQPAAKGAAGSSGGRAAAGLRVPAGIAVAVEATADQVRFRRLRGRQLQGNLRLQGQVFSSTGLTLRAAGGRASVRGTVDARQPRLLKASTVVSCQQVPLDSLFYVFEDFGQQFITQRHLRGSLTATAEVDSYYDAHLSPLTDRLEAEVHATVRNGELLNFEPLQKLSFLASRATLRHLRFAQLQNRLYVQSRTVYVPEMDIRSNVKAASLIRVTGTHTFDQQLDYHVRIPLLPGLLPQAIAGANGPELRLAIQGNEQDFTVRYERAPREATLPRVAGPSGAAPPAHTPTPAGPAAAPRPAARPSFELKKPARKPAQPQAGEYFDF